MKLAAPLILLALLISSALAQDPDLKPTPLKKFRAGEIEVETILPQGPSESVKLLKKYIVALHKNTEWWAKYAIEHENRFRGPRPYHANMGITLDEYDTLVATRDSWSWVGQEKGKLKLVQTGDSKLRILADGKFAILDGFEFDPKNDTIHYGGKTLTRQPRPPNHLGIGPLGDLQITAWKFQNHDSLIVIRIGQKSEDDTDPLIELRRAITLDGEIISNQESTIRLHLY